MTKKGRKVKEPEQEQGGRSAMLPGEPTELPLLQYSNKPPLAFALELWYDADKPGGLAQTLYLSDEIEAVVRHVLDNVDKDTRVGIYVDSFMNDNVHLVIRTPDNKNPQTTLKKIQQNT